MNPPGMLNLSSITSGMPAAFPRHLDAIEGIFTAQLATDLPAVEELTELVARYRGKMLRPTLVLLAALATVEGDESILESDDLRRLAATIEMIHMATLVHDDVLDEASERRSTPSVNRLRGNEAAVMFGDFLIANAFHLCSTIGDPFLNEALGQVTRTLCEGELVQLHLRNDLGIDQATYFEIIRRKTAVLVGAAGGLGARVAGGSETLSAAMQAYGEHLGIAFQIRDDILDLEESTETIGKTSGRDLEKGTITLPSILLLERADTAVFGDFTEAILAKNAVQVRRMVQESGAIEHALSMARTEVETATAIIREDVGGPFAPLFTELAESVLTRTP